jgi:hypothetical protein
VLSAFEQLDARHPSLLAQAAGVLIFPLSNEFGKGVLG